VKHRPTILITPSSTAHGAEFNDRSISLSNQYPQAVAHAGGLPWILPLTASAAAIRESVSRADGVLLTGGDDIQPSLYRPSLPARLQRTVRTEDPHRDWVELLVIRAALLTSKPLLAICRGHQLLNVALGGTLIVDIATEVPKALNHQRSRLKNRPVHAIRIHPRTRLARILRRSSLRVNSTHHQGVLQPAAPLTASATSPDGIVEAMEPGQGHDAFSPFLVSVQFHPERLAEQQPVLRRLFQAFVRASAPRQRSRTRPA